MSEWKPTNRLTMFGSRVKGSPADVLKACDLAIAHVELMRFWMGDTKGLSELEARAFNARLIAQEQFTQDRRRPR